MGVTYGHPIKSEYDCMCSGIALWVEGEDCVCVIYYGRGGGVVARSRREDGCNFQVY
jgi:hypothetical protein